MILREIYKMFNHFANENVGGLQIDKVVVKSINVNHEFYINIKEIPFFSVGFKKGQYLKNTFNTIALNEYSDNVLNYALSLCFFSEKSFEYEDNEQLCKIFCMSYHCTLENMGRTLSEEDFNKVIRLID